MDNVKNLIKSIHLETALLEACEWDEQECKKIVKMLSEYFNVCEKTDLDIVKVDLDLIFSEQISIIIYSYLKETIKVIDTKDIPT